MERIWIEKGYRGSGSYHGDFHCENKDCEKRFAPSKGWFSMWETEAFENRHNQISGYCCKKCLLKWEKGENTESKISGGIK